ncbi:MAG: CPBP family intramembrane glutamic endopeptidase [Hyphomonadaceae bacterium]
MSTTNKSIIFLAIAFAISWAIVIGSWALKLHENPNMLVPVLGASMFGPSIAALICALAFEKGRRAASLGLRFRPNWWWLAAYLAPILIAATSVALSIAFGGSSFVDPGAGTIAMVEQAAPEQAEQVRALAPILTPLVLAQALVIGALINAVVLTFSEELGWRGYLHNLWRGAGFWRASLGTGVVWGIWHAPAILFFGLNYPDNRAVGVGLFVAFCMLLSPILTLVRDRGASVWAAGILHGTLNAVGGLTMVTLSNPVFPWNGIVGIGGFIALGLGVALTLLLRPSRSPQTAAV